MEKDLIGSICAGAMEAARTDSFSIRTAGEDDVARLSDHFAALSPSSRYNRFMGSVNNLARIASDCLGHAPRPDRFTLVAESRAQGCDAIIGEASYAFDSDTRCGEFAISVADRWQRQGLGSALLCAVQFRAISLGHIELFGETLRDNAQMQNLAGQAGFERSRASDWRAVRFDKILVSRVYRP
jgi:RimJ/RimL family protein N-acetyltransferase